MAKLIRELETLMTYISNFAENSNRVAKDKQTKGYIQARITLPNKYWNKFQILNEQLIEQANGSELDSEYFTKDFYTSTEVVYTETLGILNDHLNKNESSTNNANLLINNQTTGDYSQSHFYSYNLLEKIKLPRFGGDLREWPSFHDLFNSIVHTNPVLSASAKFYHLKSSLYGQAEQLLRNTTISDANYSSAWKILCDRYHNKRLLVTTNLKLLNSLPSMKSEPADELRKLHDGTVEAISALEGLARPVDQWDVFITVQNLDPTTRKDWESSISKDTEFTDFATLSSFLQNRINTLEAVGVCTQKQKESKIQINKAQNKQSSLKSSI